MYPLEGVGCLRQAELTLKTQLSFLKQNIIPLRVAFRWLPPCAPHLLAIWLKVSRNAATPIAIGATFPEQGSYATSIIRWLRP